MWNNIKIYKKKTFLFPSILCSCITIIFFFFFFILVITIITFNILILWLTVRPKRNPYPYLCIQKEAKTSFDFCIPLTWHHQVSSSSPAVRGRRATTEMSSPLLRVPLERGWKRELVYRAALDQHSRRNADIYYYTPQGKKLRSTREVSLLSQTLKQLHGPKVSITIHNLIRASSSILHWYEGNNNKNYY